MVAFRCRPAVRPVYFGLLTHCFYDAPQSVESLWASDQPVAETSTWQHITLTTDKQTNIHAPGGIRIHNLSRRAAEGLRLRPRGHWDRQLQCNGETFANKQKAINSYFLLVWSLVPTLCVESYCCTCPHTSTGTHAVGFPLTWVRSVAEACTCRAHNIDKRRLSMPPEGIEPAIPASERPQTYALDRAATAIGINDCVQKE